MRKGDYTKGGQDSRSRIFDFIIDHQKEYGYPPTRREIMHECGISSTSIVTYHLGVLQEQGYIEVRPFVARGITVI